MILLRSGVSIVRALRLKGVTTTLILLVKAMLKLSLIK